MTVRRTQTAQCQRVYFACLLTQKNIQFTLLHYKFYRTSWCFHVCLVSVWNQQGADRISLTVCWILTQSLSTPNGHWFNFIDAQGRIAQDGSLKTVERKIFSLRIEINPRCSLIAQLFYFPAANQKNWKDWTRKFEKVDCENGSQGCFLFFIFGYYLSLE